MAHRIVGQPIGRLDGVLKVSGEARYSADVALPGLVWGKALRSPLPHARIRRIDTSKARALPGVLAVLTAQDLPPVLVGRRMFDMPVLARDRVRFIGEKVAAVAALDPDLAAKSRLPAVYAFREHVEAGGLMAYAANFTESYRRAATYVDKILKGATPADLPVEQPTKFEFVINLKTAKALGLTFPQSILLQATEAIQ